MPYEKCLVKIALSKSARWSLEPLVLSEHRNPNSCMRPISDLATRVSTPVHAATYHGDVYGAGAVLCAGPHTQLLGEAFDRDVCVGPLPHAEQGAAPNCQRLRVFGRQERLRAVGGGGATCVRKRSIVPSYIIPAVGIPGLGLEFRTLRAGTQQTLKVCADICCAHS